MNSGIYAITSPSGKLYVGSSQNLRKRWWGHRKSLRLGTHHCRALQFAADKYGADSLTYSVLEVCGVEQLLEREQFHMDRLGPANLYNSTLVAGSIRGFTMPPGHAARMAEVNTGRVRNADTRARMSAYQRQRTPEHLAKLAEAQRGKRATPETRAKQAAAKRGKKQTPEHIAKVREANRLVVRKNNMSGVRGVSWSSGKWVARIRLRGRYQHLGRFETIDEAELAIREVAP